KALMEKSGLQGRHAVHGLAGAGRTPCQKGSAECWRLAWFPYGLGRRRCHQSHLLRLLQFGLREGLIRLALRSKDGGVARSVLPRGRSGQAEGNRRGSADACNRDGHTRSARAMVPAVVDAQEPDRHAASSGASVLEYGDAIGTSAAAIRVCKGGLGDRLPLGAG